MKLSRFPALSYMHHVHKSSIFFSDCFLVPSGPSKRNHVFHFLPEELSTLKDSLFRGNAITGKIN